MHSVPAAPPKAASPGRCSCGELLAELQVEVDLDGVERWTPTESGIFDDLPEDVETPAPVKFGRTKFHLSSSQLHFHPSPDKFLRIQLANVVLVWELTHERRFKRSGSHRKYRGSPHTSLDIQRGALLTLEQSPFLAVTDLIWAAKQNELVAPVPEEFLKLFHTKTTAERLGSALLDGHGACVKGLHDMSLGATSTVKPGRKVPSNKKGTSPPRGRQKDNGSHAAPRKRVIYVPNETEK